MIYDVTDKILGLIQENLEIKVDDIIIILIAKKLDKKSKIRNFFEKEKNLIIVPFYEDTSQTLLSIAKKILNENKLNLSQENLNLIIERSQGDRINLKNAANNETYIDCIQNNRVGLYYDNVEKLRTTDKGIRVGTGVTVETNGQATFTGIVTATSFKLANGSDVGTGAGGTWSTYTAGIATSKSVGVNTSNLDDNDLVGVGNSFQGLYISNGMIIHDNTLNGNHYIGTAFNGLMAGPVNIEGTLTVDGNYVVV